MFLLFCFCPYGGFSKANIASQDRRAKCIDSDVGVVKKASRNPVFLPVEEIMVAFLTDEVSVR